MSNSNEQNTLSRKELDCLKLNLDNVRTFIASTAETPKKSTNATDLNISRSHALFKSRNNSENESTTLIEEGISGSVKRKRRDPQGPTNAGPKTRKIVVAATKTGVPCNCTEKQAIEYYKNLVIEESLIKLTQAKQINAQLIQIGKLSQVVSSIGDYCSSGLNQVNNIASKPRPMAISLARCHNDAVLANIHNSYVNRITQVDQQQQKIQILMHTMGNIIESCGTGLQLVKPTTVRSSTRSQTKKILITHPPQKKSTITSGNVSQTSKTEVETKIEIKTEVHTEVDYSTIEIDLPELSADQQETWDHMKKRHSFAASEKVRLEGNLFTFKERLAEKRSEEMDFTTFNISQENLENQNSSSISKPSNSSFKKFLGVTLPSTAPENPTQTPSETSSQRPLPTSMKVETGCSNSAESE